MIKWIKWVEEIKFLIMPQRNFQTFTQQMAHNISGIWVILSRGYQFVGNICRGPPSDPKSPSSRVRPAAKLVFRWAWLFCSPLLTGLSPSHFLLWEFKSGLENAKWVSLVCFHHWDTNSGGIKHPSLATRNKSQFRKRKKESTEQAFQFLVWGQAQLKFLKVPDSFR